MGGSTSGTFRSEAKDSNHTKHLDDKDMFITSFQADSGSIVWTRVFGSKGFDSVQRLATDQQVIHSLFRLFLLPLENLRAKS